jgi:hypothetical protein
MKMLPKVRAAVLVAMVAAFFSMSAVAAPYEEVPAGYLSASVVSTTLRQTLSPQGRFVIMPTTGNVRIFDTPEKTQAARLALEQLQSGPASVSVAITVTTGLRAVTRQTVTQSSAFEYDVPPGPPLIGGVRMGNYPPAQMPPQPGVQMQLPGQPVVQPQMPPPQQGLPGQPGLPAQPAKPGMPGMPPQNIGQPQMPGQPPGQMPGQPGLPPQPNMPRPMPPAVAPGAFMQPPQGGYTTFGPEVRITETSMEGGSTRRYSGTSGPGKLLTLSVQPRVADPAALHDLAVKYGAVPANEPAWTAAGTELLVTPDFSSGSLTLQVVPQIVISTGEAQQPPRRVPVKVCIATVVVSRRATTTFDGLPGANGEFYRLFFGAMEATDDTTTRISVSADVQYLAQPVVK